MRIAVLLACHNRKDLTLECLAGLHACALPENWRLQVFLLDDASSDGTSAAVEAAFPEVRVLRGDGAQFWNGGMRQAFSAAMRTAPDAYLWLNDDTRLDADALQRLATSAAALRREHPASPPIVVGATRDPDSGSLTYGGLILRGPRWRNRYHPVPVGARPQRCDTLNGNCVLVPAAVVEAIGNIDPAFVHAIGDWDYGLRAGKAGFPVWQAPGSIGTCRGHPPARLSWRTRASVRAQWRRVTGPKGVPPAAWMVYVRRHYGVTWPLHFLAPYLNAVSRALVAKLDHKGRSGQ